MTSHIPDTSVAPDAAHDVPDTPTLAADWRDAWQERIQPNPLVHLVGDDEVIDYGAFAVLRDPSRAENGGCLAAVDTFALSDNNIWVWQSELFVYKKPLGALGFFNLGNGVIRQQFIHRVAGVPQLYNRTFSLDYAGCWRAQRWMEPDPLTYWPVQGWRRQIQDLPQELRSCAIRDTWDGLWSRGGSILGVVLARQGLEMFPEPRLPHFTWHGTDFWLGSAYRTLKEARKDLAQLIRDELADGDYVGQRVLELLATTDRRNVMVADLLVEAWNEHGQGDGIQRLDCAHFDFRGEGCRVVGGNYVCRECLDEYYIVPEDGSEFHLRSDLYLHSDGQFYLEDEDDFDDEEQGIGSVGDYHTSRELVGHIDSRQDREDPPVLLGLELEMEVSDDESVGWTAQQLAEEVAYVTDVNGYQQRYMALEHDGSLNDGFEMVTGYTGLDVHERALLAFKAPRRIPECLRSHDTSTCGLHIHVDKKGMTLAHGVRLMVFIHNPENEGLLISLARRDGEEWAKRYDKLDRELDGNVLDQLYGAKEDWGRVTPQNRARYTRYALSHLNDDRYEAVNFKNSDTVEFRLFRGTLKYETIMACLEFVRATWFFTKDASLRELDTAHFITFVNEPRMRKTTRYLRTYLKGKGYSTYVAKPCKTAAGKEASDPGWSKSRADSAAVAA